jgi:hypothetical protein
MGTCTPRETPKRSNWVAKGFRLQAPGALTPHTGEWVGVSLPPVPHSLVRALPEPAPDLVLRTVAVLAMVCAFAPAEFGDPARVVGAPWSSSVGERALPARFATCVDARMQR